VIYDVGSVEHLLGELRNGARFVGLFGEHGSGVSTNLRELINLIKGEALVVAPWIDGDENGWSLVAGLPDFAREFCSSLKNTCGDLTQLLKSSTEREVVIHQYAHVGDSTGAAKIEQSADALEPYVTGMLAVLAQVDELLGDQLIVVVIDDVDRAPGMARLLDAIDAGSPSKVAWIVGSHDRESGVLPGSRPMRRCTSAIDTATVPFETRGLAGTAPKVLQLLLVGTSDDWFGGLWNRYLHAVGNTQAAAASKFDNARLLLGAIAVAPATGVSELRLTKDDTEALSICRPLWNKEAGRIRLFNPGFTQWVERVPFDDQRNAMRAKARELTTARIFGRSFLPETSAVFVARDRLVSELHLRLQTGDAGITQSIDGLGGVGKTQLLIRYIESHGVDYAWVGVVSGENPDRFIEGISRIASELQIPMNYQNLEEAIYVIERLSRMKDRWLIALDNVENWSISGTGAPLNSAIGAFSEDGIGEGRLLITGRNLSQIVRNSEPITIGPFVEEESIEFLQKDVSQASGDLSGRRFEELGGMAGAKAVHEVLNGLPIALHHAARYVVETEWTLQQYVDAIKKDDVLHHSVDGDRNSSESDVFKTFELAMKHMQSKRPEVGPMALAVLAFGSSDVVAGHVIDAAKVAIPARVAEAGVVASSNVAPFALAEKLGLIQRASDGQGYSMHRVVAHVARTKLVQEDPTVLTGTRSRRDLLFDILADISEVIVGPEDKEVSVEQEDAIAVFAPHLAQYLRYLDTYLADRGIGVKVNT
jgi:hypothetical protein